MHTDLRQRIDEAAERFEKARRALLRPDGGSKFSIVEHQELEGVAEKEFHDRLSRVEDEVEGRVARVEERLLRLEHSDPSASLTAEELEAANARRAFISDEVLSLSPEALEQRIRALISAGDRAGAFVYANLLRSLANDAEYGDPAAEANRLRLEQLARELEAALDPEASGRLEKAQAEIEELRKIRDYAYLRKNGAKDPVELYLNKAYGATKY
jgi:hypothetical protein